MTPTDLRPPSTVLLIDASPYIFRSFFALPSSIQAPDGSPNNAAHGFASFLIKLLGEERPSHVGVAFDGSLTTSFRNEIYPEYKANRDLPPPELTSQLDRCRAIGAALGASVDISQTFEADDIIASWLHCMGEELGNANASIVTSDKDLAQLVIPNVELYDFAKDARWTADTVEQKYGVKPQQLVDFQALAGDSVDNIPGVKGIGPKTAATLLQHFHDLDDMLTNLHRVPNLALRGSAGIARRLDDQREQALLSRQLATLATNAPVANKLETLRWDGPSDHWPQLCAELGFGTMLDRGLALQPADQ